MTKIPEQCPSCGGELHITRLACPACGTEVHGQYPRDLFSRLSPTDYQFVVLFVRSRGNVKEMERELGISYWTIRSKLNEIVAQLGLETSAPGADDLSARRQVILRQLNEGMITVDEAEALLQQLKRA